MRLGPFRIRIGVISSEDDSLNLVNELMRSTISTGSMASCSFYVPLLTPIAFVVFCNTAEKRGSVLVRFRSGSRIDEDSFQWDESSVRVYGELAHVTGFEGKDIKLLATEETIKIDLIDETDGELMASFRYKHLEPSEVSQDTNLALVDYSNDNGLKSIEGVFNDENSLPPSPALDAQANASEDKRKEGSDQYGSDVGSSDEEDMEITHSKIVFRGHGLLAPATGSNLSTPEKKKRRPSSQLTPLRQTKLSKSFTPSVKASSSHGRTISNIKAEDSDLKPLPRFDPSPSLQLIKDSQKKVAGLDGQIDVSDVQGGSQPVSDTDSPFECSVTR